jgi:hypothetical protein
LLIGGLELGIFLIERAKDAASTLPGLPEIGEVGIVHLVSACAHAAGVLNQCVLQNAEVLASAATERDAFEEL